jgi:hypothetical protein
MYSAAHMQDREQGDKRKREVVGCGGSSCPDPQISACFYWVLYNLFTRMMRQPA